MNSRHKYKKWNKKSVNLTNRNNHAVQGHAQAYTGGLERVRTTTQHNIT